MNYKWKAMITVAMGTMMATMDASITTIAFPELVFVFESDLATVMWVAVAYILVSSSLMLIMGKISDLTGRKRVYACGTAIFTLGMGACAFTQTIDQLIIARIVQALGAAMSISCGTAIVAEAFPPSETGKGMGFLGMSVSAGFILGPIVGGFLLEWLDWRALFYARVPVCIFTLILAIVLLKRDSGNPGKFKLDLLGAFISSCGLFSLIFGLSRLNKFGTTGATVLLYVGGGVLMLVLFVFQERRVVDPLVDISLFRNRIFTLSLGGLFLFFLAVPPYILVMPFYLLEGIQLSPLETGLLMAVVSVVTLIVNPISGSLSDRFGPVWLSTLGAGATATAFLLMLDFDLQTKISTIVIDLVLLGVGVGSFQAPNNSTIMGSVERERLGSASALIATQRQMGISMGMAFSGAIFSAQRSGYFESFLLENMNEKDAFRLSIPPAYHDVLLISVVLTFCVMMLAILSAYGKRKKISTTIP